MTRVIAITGPTASGKSAVAERLALALSTEVISADAMQVYRGMDIGTAKIPVGERRAPLRLVDVVEPAQPYSAALYQRDARAAIDELRAQGRVPVLCGGTGLYIRAALDDMRFPSGEVGDERRANYQGIAEREGAEALHGMLRERDPESAELIHPHNVKRVIRALEMCDAGVSYAEQVAGFHAVGSFYPHDVYVLTMQRDRLYRRIDARVDLMMEQGLLAEVEGLLDRGLRDALTSMQAIGYKELIRAIDGELTLEEAVGLIKQRSRRYAKRQLAWFRRDKRSIWIDMDAKSEASAADFIYARIGA